MRFADHADTWEGRATAWLLKRPGGVLSHRSAAYIYEMPLAAPVKIDITTPMQCKQGGNLKMHTQPGVFGYSDHRNGFPVTNPAKTLIDLASVVGTPNLERCLEYSLLNKLTNAVEICEVLASLATSAKQNCAALERLLGNNSMSHLLDSQLEALMLKALRRNAKAVITPQYTVLVDGRKFVLDFAFLASKVTVEVDGPHHFFASRATKDRRRDASLTSAGWVVLRCTRNTDLVEFSAQVKAIISARRA